MFEMFDFLNAIAGALIVVASIIVLMIIAVSGILGVLDPLTIDEGLNETLRSLFWPVVSAIVVWRSGFVIAKYGSEDGEDGSEDGEDEE